MKQLPIPYRSILLFLAAIAIAILTAIAPAWSLTAEGGEQVIIPSDEVIEDDLYVAGQRIIINGTVDGDVIGAGREITLNGTITGDLMVAGQSIVINGTVEDDVRIAGQVLQVGADAQIADDLVAAGLSLESQPGSLVGGRLSYTGAQALLAGTVQGSLTGATNALDLRGTVEEDVDVVVGNETIDTLDLPFLPSPAIAPPTVPGGLTVRQTAQIGSDLIYESSTAATISPDAQIGGNIIRDELQPTTVEPQPVSVFWIHLQRFITLLLVGLLLLWTIPQRVSQLAHVIEEKPLPSLGWGVLTLVAVGVMAIAIVIGTMILTLISAIILPFLVPLALGVGFLASAVLMLGFFLYVAYVPQVVVSVLVGRRILRSRQPRGAIGDRLLPLAVGLLVFIVLTAIPILGGLINFIVILLGLGALWIVGRQRLTPSPSDRSPVHPEVS